MAAGNEHSDLGKLCDYFPACYDRRLVVGNLFNMSPDVLTKLKLELDDPTISGSFRSPSSNYGTYVNRWEVGTDVESTLPGGKKGTMSGTSQATAVATGKLVREFLKK